MFLLILTSGDLNVFAQDTSFHPKHRAIYFPYPMYKEKWRSSIGFNLIATPEDITEELRIRIPTLDYHALRRISNHVILDTRWHSQIVQNLFQLGPHWRTPINKDLYVDVGNDLGYWFGILKLEGFNSSASGWQDNITVSMGYKTKNDLLITIKGELCYNLYYQAKNGENAFSSNRMYYNGEMVTIALEQPFYNRQHITLALSAIRSRFNWQTWSLFYKTDRKIFYPQITVGFIL